MTSSNPDALVDPVRPKLKRDWKGRLARLRRRETTRGGVVFEAGEIVRIVKNHGGLLIESICREPICGRWRRCEIRGVSESAVDLLVRAVKSEEPRSKMTPVDVRALAREILDSVGGGNWKAETYRAAAARLEGIIRPLEVSRASWEAACRDIQAATTARAERAEAELEKVRKAREDDLTISGAAGSREP